MTPEGRRGGIGEDQQQCNDPPHQRRPKRCRDLGQMHRVLIRWQRKLHQRQQQTTKYSQPDALLP